MAYDGRAIANFVLDYCDQKGRSVTHLALQKLVYFCHVWSLVHFKQPLVKHKFEAWERLKCFQCLRRGFFRHKRN